MSPEDKRISRFRKQVKEKIGSIGYSPDFFSYILVEELILLLRVSGARVELHENDSLVDVDSNILDEERGKLKKKFAVAPSTSLSPGMVLKNFPTPLGSVDNSNLQNVDAQLVVTVACESRSLVLTLWFERRLIEGEILDSLLSEPQIQNQLIEALQDLLKTASSRVKSFPGIENRIELKQATTRDFIDQKRAFFKEHQTTLNDEFLKAYDARFRPLDAITTRLIRAFELEAPQRSSGQLDYFFSFRSAREGAISFFFTSSQMSSLLGPRFQRQEIQDFLEFRFGADLGLSGYVLATGHSEFCRDPEADPRWGKSLNRSSEISAQLDLINRLHSSPDSANPPKQRNVFLLPLFVQRIRSSARTLPKNYLYLFVECELPDERDQQFELRSKLFHLAWEFMPLVEAAILAQQQTEELVTAVMFQHLEAHTMMLCHNFPKFLGRPTSNTIKKINLLIDELRENTAQKSATLNKISDALFYLDVMAEHYSSFFEFFRLSAPTLSEDAKEHFSRQDLDENGDRDSEESKGRFLSEEFADKLRRFVRIMRERLTYAHQSLPQERSATGLYKAIKAEVKLSSFFSRRVAILCDPSVIFEMVINHVGNSIDALIKDNGELLRKDPQRGAITVEIDVKRGSAQSSFLIIRVVDRGPGMDERTLRSYSTELSEIFERGSLPEFNKRYSHKAEHLGAGILINAHILSSYRRDPRFSYTSGQMNLSRTEPSGLTVELRIPVRLYGPRIEEASHGQSQTEKNHPSP